MAEKKSQKALRRVTGLCLALPAAECTRSGDHATYRVRGKVFAYFLDDHHGDGIVSVCVKSEPRGWFGMRLDRPGVDWKEVARILERSYRLTAPKKLLAELERS